MKIECSNAELHGLFGNAVVMKRGVPERLFINSNEFFVVSWERGIGSTFFGGNTVTEVLYLEQVTVLKSPQEVAAQESVEKAEAALNAAKEVLSKVVGK